MHFDKEALMEKLEGDEEAYRELMQIVKTNLEDIQYEQGVHEFEQKENQKPWESKTFVILALLMLIVLIFSLILNFKPI